MTQTVGFDIPKGMSPQDVARAFAVYLQGHLAFQSSHDKTNRFYCGPFEKKRHGEINWQLDISNNYWLYIFPTGNRAAISCLYPKQIVILEAMVKLFNACYSSTSQANCK